MSKNRPFLKNWEWRKLGDITTERLIGLVRNSTEQKSSFSYSYLKMDSIKTNSTLNLDLATKVNATQKEVDRYSLQSGDFLFNTRNSYELVGKTAVFESEENQWLYNNNIMRIRFNEDINPYFINLAFQSNLVKRQLNAAKNKTTSVCAIYDYHLVEIEIPIPPLEEQKRIAAILDKADRIRRKRQEAIRLTEELGRSIFLDMFGDPVTNPKGWGEISLGKISKVQGGLQITPKRKVNDIEVPYLRVANVYRDKLNLEEIKLISVTEQELTRTSLKKGDLLIVEGHGNNQEIGRSSVWDGSIPDCVHQNHLIRVRVDVDKADPGYVSNFLNSAGGRRQLKKCSKTTSGLNTISSSNVKAIQILLPPVEIQKKYVELQVKVIAGCKKLSLHSSESENLFNSLLQRAFRGEL